MTSLFTSTDNIRQVKETTGSGEGVVSLVNLVGGRTVVGFTSSSRYVRYSRGLNRSGAEVGTAQATSPLLVDLSSIFHDASIL
jgi:peptidoglycan hydrolase-like protein with peptidoglycan-binding domain